MRLRIGRLVAGALLLALGLGMIGTADRTGDKIVYTLTVIGCVVGAAMNAARRRRAGALVTWRHVANGGWLGGILVPTGVAVALSAGSPGAVGQAFGGALVEGLIVGYGLGLCCSGFPNFTTATVGHMAQWTAADPEPRMTGRPTQGAPSGR